MAAIVAAEKGVASVALLEATSKFLEKVRLSGGGRCNVTHNCLDIKDLINHYPRGQSSLLGSFSRFACEDTINWFAERGIDLVIEKDGRMFPLSNSSSSIVDCLRNSAVLSGVTLLKQSLVDKVVFSASKGFSIHTRLKSTFFSDRIVLATGGHPIGRKIAANFGHSIINPIPSLFTFTVDSFLLKNLSGLSVNNVVLKLFIGKKFFIEKGTLLITHWGFSGPSILRLSAFSARKMYEVNYCSTLVINWLNLNHDELKSIFFDFRNNNKGTLSSKKPFPSLPKRLWVSFLNQAGISSNLKWAELSKKDENKLIILLIASTYRIKGRGPFGEEFVTAGGVKLDEVNLITMESRLCPGLFFAGELLDVDGVTGGFNFQHCWTSGWLAANAIANSNK